MFGSNPAEDVTHSIQSKKYKVKDTDLKICDKILILVGSAQESGIERLVNDYVNEFLGS